jgi:solute carrier family 35 protein E3
MMKTSETTIDLELLETEANELLKKTSLPHTPPPENSNLTFLYMVMNICSSVGIVMTNKWIFQQHKFQFATTVTIIHFLFTFIGLEICAIFGLFQKKKLAYSEVLPLSVAFCSFVVLTNISLQFNSVGFYQV